MVKEGKFAIKLHRLIMLLRWKDLFFSRSIHEFTVRCMSSKVKESFSLQLGGIIHLDVAMTQGLRVVTAQVNMSRPF